jgi:CRP-like cAMP-binding protein
MNTSVIRHRVADFLSHHAPFDSLPQAELLELAAGGRVKFHESEEFIFDLGGSYGNLLWVVQQGEVELLDGRGRLLDVKGCGDVLGLERFSAASTPGPVYAAVTKTDVILYGVPAAMFSGLIEHYPVVREFVEAHVSVADVHGFARTSWLDSPAPPLEFLRARNAGANHALRVDCALTTRAIVREMVRLGVEQITVDSMQISASDLALFCGANPPTLLRYLREAATPAERDVLLNRLSVITREALAQPGDPIDIGRHSRGSRKQNSHNPEDCGGRMATVRQSGARRTAFGRACVAGICPSW